MNRYRKEDKPGLYHALAVHECPLSLIQLSIELASDFVTVENFRPTRYTREWTELALQLYPDDTVRPQSVRNAVLDVSMNKEEFRRHLRVWDRQGVYAVFTRQGPLGFRATDLDEPARYRALQNYDWTLELAVPDSSGGEWGRIASPDPAIIQQLHDAAEVGATIGGAAIGFGMGSRQREAWRDVDPRFLPIAAPASDLGLSVSLRL